MGIPRTALDVLRCYDVMVDTQVVVSGDNGHVLFEEGHEQARVHHESKRWKGAGAAKEEMLS